MACFVVPAAEAAVTMICGKVLEAREKKVSLQEGNDVENADVISVDAKLPFSKKLKWLSDLLWGGSLLLAFEHMWHGEIVPWFPFLTAVADGEISGVLHEMATTGVTMAALVTLVWGGMVVVSNAIENRESEQDLTE